MEHDNAVPDVPCEVIPRPDATPEQLKVLGTALASWGEREAVEGGLVRHFDVIALLDLLGGGDPGRAVEEILGWPGPEPAPAATQPAPMQAPVKLTVLFCLRGGAAYDRRRVIESLRSAIPAELVEDVLIDRRSWDDTD